MQTGCHNFTFHLNASFLRNKLNNWQLCGKKLCRYLLFTFYFICILLIYFVTIFYPVFKVYGTLCNRFIEKIQREWSIEYYVLFIDQWSKTTEFKQNILRQCAFNLAAICKTKPYQSQFQTAHKNSYFKLLLQSHYSYDLKVNFKHILFSESGGLWSI